MTLVGHALDDPELVRLLLDVHVGSTLDGIIAGVRRREAEALDAARAMVAAYGGRPAGPGRRIGQDRPGPMDPATVAPGSVPWWR